MTTIQYFAYGSNMLTERLRARCRSAAVNCVAVLNGHRILFTKRGKDGSGKATIHRGQTLGCRVTGVVFNLEITDLPVLDKFEGAGIGYDRVDHLTVQAFGTNGPLMVTTYIARPDYIDAELKPFDWYVALVAAGARQHRLPADVVAAIEAVPWTADPQTDRPTRLEALALLEKARS